MSTHTITGAINDLWHKADEICDIAANDVFLGNITEDQYYFQMEEVDMLQQCAEFVEEYRLAQHDTPGIWLPCACGDLLELPELVEVGGKLFCKDCAEDACPGCGGELIRDSVVTHFATRTEPAEYAQKEECFECGYMEVE
jgi:hypothetical protein